MLQETVSRLEGLDGAQAPIAIANEEHRFLVAEQLREISRPAQALVLEPAGRGTAAAAAAAALLLPEKAGVMLVMTPDGRGGHILQPATTLGFGFRLFDFVPPLFKKQVSLHINIARTSLHGGQDARSMPSTPNLNLFGLSVSTRRHR